MNELQHLHFCKQKDNLCFDRRRCDMSLPGESGFAQDTISISQALFLCGAGSQQLSCLASWMIDQKRRRLFLWKNGLELSNFICNLDARHEIERMTETARWTAPLSRGGGRDWQWCQTWTVQISFARVLHSSSLPFCLTMRSTGIIRPGRVWTVMFMSYWVPPIPENMQNQANPKPTTPRLNVLCSAWGSLGLRFSLCFWYLIFLLG